MKTFFLSLFILFSLSAFAQVDVTFQVDMSNETVSMDGVHIAGSLNGWDTSANLLSDDDGDGVYTVTINLSADSDFEYKYLNGNAWGSEETPPMECAVGGNNRIFTSGSGAITLPVVPFSGCPSPNPVQQVTFTVDMRLETVSPNGVYIAGNFNGWNPSVLEMSLIGNNFYQVTADVLSSLTTVQYKFINGNNWGFEESIPTPCVNGNSNRDYMIGGLGNDIMLPAFEFGTCNEVSIILPIVLESFRGSTYERGAFLEWVTALEVNNEGFEVQHSRDGKDWKVLTFVKGAGSVSKSKIYTYKHNSPQNGMNYYRLKQMDFDGQFEYSDIISVAYESGIVSPSVYPNPAVDNLMINNANGTVILYDIQGKPLKELKTTDDQIKMDISDLQTGNYFLKIFRENGSTFNFNIMK